jgi:hypothetical protein
MWSNGVITKKLLTTRQVKTDIENGVQLRHEKCHRAQDWDLVLVTKSPLNLALSVNRMSG